MKEQEKNLNIKTNMAAQISLTAIKLTEMTYKSTIIKWNNPDLLFESDKFLGKIKIDNDSLTLVGPNNVFLTKVGCHHFTYEHFTAQNGDIVIKRFSLYMDKIEHPFVFEKEPASDVLLNSSIKWQ